MEGNSFARREASLEYPQNSDVGPKKTVGTNVIMGRAGMGRLPPVSEILFRICLYGNSRPNSEVQLVARQGGAIPLHLLKRAESFKSPKRHISAIAARQTQQSDQA